MSKNTGLSLLHSVEICRVLRITTLHFLDRFGWHWWGNTAAGRLEVLWKVWEVLVTLIMTSLFIYQVGLNIQLFRDLPTVFLVSLEPNPSFRLPPLSICPQPAFDPTKLKDVGLDISGNHMEFNENYLNLTGVPGDVTPAQIWDETQWNFGQLISSVTLDNPDGREMFEYTPTDELPSMWHRSFSPLGPCMTLNAPPGVTNLVVYVTHIPKVEPCMISYSNSEETYRYNGNNAFCDQVENKCNSSCGLEDLIYFALLRFKVSYVYFHKTPVYASGKLVTAHDIMKYSRQLFDGNYILRDLLLTPSLLTEPQLTDTSLIKGSCTHDGSYSFADCFQKHHSQDVLRGLGCSPVYFGNFRNSSQHTCRSPKLMRDMFDYQNLHGISCPQKCKRQTWSHLISDSFSFDYAVGMTATTTDMRREVEVETYPLAQLFSDTGGSLGLFLGVSILTFWNLLMAGTSTCCKVFFNKDNHSKKLMHLIALIKYMGILLLAMATCTHGLEILRSYLTQPKFTSVSLKVKTSAGTDGSVGTLVARRLAMQSLGCRPQETTGEECLVTCLLEQSVDEVASVAPFVRVEGFPLCQDGGISVPSYVYVVPPEFLVVATHVNKITKCNQTCQYVSVTNTTNTTTTDHSLFMTVDNDHYAFSSLQLVCSLGGIIGLYLGYSILDFLDLPQSLSITQDRLRSSGISAEKSSTIYHIMKMGICTVGGVLALWQVHTFLMNHEISATINQTNIVNRTEPLSLTVCRWPPLSLHHVAGILGVNISERTLLKMPEEQRLPELLRVLDTLPGNWSVSLDDMWTRAAWNLTDVVEAFYVVRRDGLFFSGFCAYAGSDECSGLWTPVTTTLNRCFSFNASHQNSDIVEITVLFPDKLHRTNIYGEGSEIYYTVHPTNQPPQLANMIPRTEHRTNVATHYTATYQHLGHQQQQLKTTDGQDQDTISHGSCVHQCLSEAATQHLNCRLPYVVWRPDLPPCDQDQYQAVPAFFKGLEGIGKYWNKLKNSHNVSQDLVNARENCYGNCRHLQRKHSIVTLDDTLSDSYGMIVVHLSQEEDLVVREEDHYTTSQLLSDLGGIAGSTAGFSLLFLVKDLIPKLVTAQSSN